MNSATPLPLYLIGLGSNRRHVRHGDPRHVLLAALEALECPDIEAVDTSPIRSSAPLGPSRRTFANAAALVASALPPPRMLERLQAIESAFGRRIGQRWGARTLDLDILLWSGGMWSDDRLVIPHPAFRDRAFTLEPLAALVPGWRDPVSAATMRQLLSRFHRRKPVDHWARCL